MNGKSAAGRPLLDGQMDSGYRLRAIMDAAADGIIGIDERGIVQLINPAAARLFGYAAQELIGKSFNILLPSTDPAGPDRSIAGSLPAGQAKGHEVVGRRQDGTTFPLDMSVSEARLGPERIFVVTVREFAGGQRTEAWLRLVVESTPNAIVIVNAGGNIVFVNAQAEKFFGYGRTELLGQPVELLVPERFRAGHPKDRAGFFAAPSARPMGAGRDLYGRRKDGSEFPVEIGLTPIDSGEGLLVISAIVDITERKRAEADLRRSHEELQRLVTELRAKNEEVRGMTQQLWQAAKLASVGELAASIAHELNNPLATVSLRVESVLSRTPADDVRRRPLEVIQQEARRMGELVANLLQFSRRSEGQASTVDVRQELTKAVELIHHVLRKRLITVNEAFAADTPTIYADRQKLRQVFLNLLSNAADAMPEGGTLTLRTAVDMLASGKPAVRIEFTDTGAGIPAENLERIQEPFFTTKEEGKGTGLGLAICRRVIQEHHGTMQITSAVGQGTTVRVVLPVGNGGNVQRLRGGGTAE